jgi:hypothetical protein
MKVWSISGMTRAREKKVVLEEKLVPVPLCAP